MMRNQKREVTEVQQKESIVHYANMEVFVMCRKPLCGSSAKRIF
jgi:hypothetical protein